MRSLPTAAATGLASILPSGNASSRALAAAVAASAAQADAGAAPQPDADAALMKLGEELDRVEAEIQEADALSASASGYPAAERVVEARTHSSKAIMHRIADLPAHTLAGLAVKARAVAYIHGGSFSAEGMELVGVTDACLIWSILADLAPQQAAAAAASDEDA